MGWKAGRRLTTKSWEISKRWDWVFKYSHHSQLQQAQAPVKFQSNQTTINSYITDIRISRDLVVRRLVAYRLGNMIISSQHTNSCWKWYINSKYEYRKWDIATCKKLHQIFIIKEIKWPKKNHLQHILLSDAIFLECVLQCQFSILFIRLIRIDTYQLSSSASR